MDGGNGAEPRNGLQLRRSCAAHVLLEPGVSVEGAQLALTTEIEHHLLRVVRLRDGELVSATDGAGSWRIFLARRVSDGLVLDANGDAEFEPLANPFTIACAMPKGDRLEWLVQKTAELGAARIALLEAERSVVRWSPDRRARNTERLQRIADEAVRQSRRVWRSIVDPPVDAIDVIVSAAIAEPGGSPVAGDEKIIAIGPEGGWSPNELERAETTVDLGDSVLRVETAAVVATTLRMVKHH